MNHAVTLAAEQLDVFGTAAFLPRQTMMARQLALFAGAAA
jgi:hypothetical protein